MTLAGDPASGHAHTCRKQRSTIVTPPTMLLYRRRQPSRSLRAQHISKCCATPCTSDSPSRSTHRPCDEVTRSMQLCDPEKSHSGHFMLQQHAFGTEHTRAGTPSRAPIYRKYLRAGLTVAHVCTRPCSLIPLGPGLLKKPKLRTVRSSGVSGSKSLVWALICVPSRDGSNRLHGAHAGQPLAANRLPSASWHPDRHT